MSESYWQEPYSEINIEPNEVFCQSFSPLWSHTLEYIRVYLRTSLYPTSYKISIRYLGADGKPTGADISAITIIDEHRPYGAYTNTRQRKMPPIRLVKTINYALLIEPFDFHPRSPPKTRYQPPPTTYSRGHLFKSIDGGDTWDTTSLGNLLFSEFGDPPLKPTPYTPPFDHWSIDDYSYAPYNTSACIRIATTSPTMLYLLRATQRPTPIETYTTLRGVSTLCLDHYTFRIYHMYTQLEKNESIYHTFHIPKLEEGRKWWFAFTAKADFITAPSTGPIFEHLHPEAPPFTSIKRPNAPGDRCEIPSQNGAWCPDHYLNIDEATPDEDTTCVINNTPGSSIRSDIYTIPDLEPIATSPINKVHLTIRCRSSLVTHGGTDVWCLIKTHGTEYLSPAYTSASTAYENFHWHIYLNPHTGLPWTLQEVNNLQIGVQLRRRRGVGWGIVPYCTQVYCKIYHDCSAYE